MKKVLFLITLIVASAAFVACGDDDDDIVIPVTDLPAQAQTFLTTHFPDASATLVQKDDDSYDVFLSTGFKVEFTLAGEWKDVYGNGQILPASVLALIPESIPAYVSQNYPGQSIVEVNREYGYYEIEITSRLELIFSLAGDFIRIDD